MLAVIFMVIILPTLYFMWRWEDKKDDEDGLGF